MTNDIIGWKCDFGVIITDRFNSVSYILTYFLIYFHLLNSNFIMMTYFVIPMAITAIFWIIFAIYHDEEEKTSGLYVSLFATSMFLWFIFTLANFEKT